MTHVCRYSLSLSLDGTLEINAQRVSPDLLIVSLEIVSAATRGERESMEVARDIRIFSEKPRQERER
jgi:hypothetical protein